MAHRFSSDVHVVQCAAAAAVVAAALAAVEEAECLEAPYVQMSVACCGYVVLVGQVINQNDPNEVLVQIAHVSCPRVAGTPARQDVARLT